MDLVSLTSPPEPEVEVIDCQVAGNGVKCTFKMTAKIQRPLESAAAWHHLHLPVSVSSDSYAFWSL